MVTIGVHFTQDLGYHCSDLDKTLGVYRVYPEIIHRHIFDFRIQPQTGSELFFMYRKFECRKQMKLKLRENAL